MQKISLTAVIMSLFVFGCSSNDSENTAEPFDLRAAITTGSDETSTILWDCAFDDTATVEIETGTNTVTFWENGRGITGGGSLYTWSITDADKLEGLFESGLRSFIFENFVFDDNNTFTAIDRSTRDIGTPDERTLIANTSCIRMGF